MIHVGDRELDSVEVATGAGVIIKVWPPEAAEQLKQRLDLEAEAYHRLWADERRKLQIAERGGGDPWLECHGPSRWPVRR